MQIALCYYSSTGNTELTCRYIAHKIANAHFDLVNVARDGNVDLSSYEVVGLAAPTFFFGVPPLFRAFVERLPDQQGKPAFILNTFGMMSGQTLKQMEKLATAQGLRVIAAHSLNTPENYPPFVAKGQGNTNAPGEKELAAFHLFIEQLDRRLGALQVGQSVERSKIKLSLFDNLMRPGSLDKARQEMGTLAVDEARCNGCGTCSASCPYHAITFTTKPVFSGPCHGCWSCFNHCPQQAIFTTRLRGVGQYAKPAESLAAKLSF